jgi:hypothetical protein
MFPRRAKIFFFSSFFSLFVLLLHKIFALVLCQTQIIPVSLHAPQLDSNSSTFVGALEISNLKSVAPISRRDLFNNLIVILMRSDCERTGRSPIQVNTTFASATLLLNSAPKLFTLLLHTWPDRCSGTAKGRTVSCVTMVFRELATGEGAGHRFLVPTDEAQLT